MRSKKNMIKRLVSLLLCSAICVVAAAAADNWQYSKWTATVTGKSNIKYHSRTAITASKGLVRSTATILTTDGTQVPANYVKASAELYRGQALASYGGPCRPMGLEHGCDRDYRTSKWSGKVYSRRNYLLHG